jgi:hypothetical protein
VSKVYRIHEGSLQEQFDALRSKVQFYGGGFANGKTSASVVLKALKWARDYPGSNGLIARSTYPKLNDTIRKEFLKWCPKHWIKSFPLSANASNTCTLSNGSTINFRYVAQQSTSVDGQGTSNLLSATYDWIIVDQIEDPEIVEKDFDDLLGRLRGMTPYIGDDPTMPRTGPRYFVITSNPTRNWVYKKIIQPYHIYRETGVISPQLLCERDANDRPVLDDAGKPHLLLGVVEGSTYENAENLEPDFIKTLESTYRGSMKQRFLLGGWGSYEGLIYPQFDPTVHILPYDAIMDYLGDLQQKFYELQYVEGYDFGIAVPSCYLIGISDAWGNTFLIDGFYEKGENMPVEDQREEIKRLRDVYGVRGNQPVMADPAIFRRTSATRRTVGISTADVFHDNGMGVRMVRGNNDILNGIIKVSTYLSPSKMHQHPLTGEHGAPHLYVADTLTYVIDEFGTYMWATNTRGERDDKPRDKDDHAMDTIKYLLSRRPEVARLPRYAVPKPPAYLNWHTRDSVTPSQREHRYR